MEKLLNSKGNHARFFTAYLLLMSVLSFAPTAALGNDYYVATSGSDSNPGTENQPWRTIQKAASTAIAGDIVYVKAGIYNERVVVENSGAEGNYITFAPYSSDVVTIDGNGISMPAWESGLFDLEDRSYIKISGFRVINAGPNDNNCGIYVDDCNHIIIENNYTYNTTSSGIGVWNSENIIIDGNEVELACNDGEQECITVAVTNTFEIRNNHVHNGGPGTNGGEGIDVKDGSANGKVFNNYVHDIPYKLGVYIEAWDKHTYNIEVYQNKIHNCGGDGMTLASEQGGLLENISVFNNIVYNNQNIGISVTPNGAVPNSPMQKIKIVNNTIYNNGWDTVNNPWGGGIGIESPNLSDLTIRNNIVSQNLLFQIAIESVQNYTADFNLIDGFRGELGEEIYGTDYITGDPKFENPSGADFHLKATSPAIDKGNPTDAPLTDFDGNSRPFGTAYDIGAFEYGADATSVNHEIKLIPDNFRLFQNYPNPFNPTTTIEFVLPKKSFVTLKLYNIVGEEIAVLVDEELEAGVHKVNFHAEVLPSGLYFYRLETEEFVQAKKLTLMR